jgi:ADP-ribosyl-[dinitrogen reductase] hydrolase
MKEREFVVSLEYRGGRVGLARCPGLDRPADLSADVAKFRAWGATAVVTGLSEREISHLGLGELGDAIESLGMDWHHVPIADFGVPDQKAEARWRYASLRLRRDLSQGGAAVFHCRGGLGRTGTLAARFLIDMGENPESAVGRDDLMAKYFAGRPDGLVPYQLERLLAARVGSGSRDDLSRG